MIIKLRFCKGLKCISSSVVTSSFSLKIYQDV